MEGTPWQMRPTRLVLPVCIAKKLSSGKYRVYYSAFRGGPRFWTDADVYDESDRRYVSAYEPVLRDARPGPKNDGKSTTAVLERYRTSADFVNLQTRTRKDYSLFLDDFEREFGSDPIELFAEKESLGEIREWRSQWSHSPKRYDYAGTVITKFLNWSVEEDAALAIHHHRGVKKTINRIARRSYGSPKKCKCY